MVKILVNGQVYVTNFNISLYDFLDFLLPESEGCEFIVEYNHEIVFYENYKKINLTDYDKIELITIVGGG
uniref:Thiamine biosynthesis protein n=1 Tax=Pseudellipsoidion edaphicum TaxID=1431838 RepID=A0A3R5QSQ7_9STRA|nr:Thiamine biosynthesis protein [Pseudellipsoidion edaphicum]QAA12002.1 Thiamine biosynthesis protein [Pseudellipsoidion edaphicum]